MRRVLESKKDVPVAYISTLVKCTAIGLLTAEAWYFALAFRVVLVNYIRAEGHEVAGMMASLAGVALLVAYLISRNCISIAFRIIRSGRFDVFVAFAAGVLIAYSFEATSTSLYAHIASLIGPRQLLDLVALLLLLQAMITYRTIQIRRFNPQQKSSAFFVSDAELMSKQDDLLDVANEAEQFAQRVLNYGSSECVVFGIDAPWGIGKSTFVNLCQEFWRNNKERPVVLYDFDPLLYENSKNVLEPFVDGLVRAFQQDSFVPELQPLISKYSRFVEGVKGRFSLFGIEIIKGTYSIDDALDDLRAILERFDKQIIVVVDDLDRLTFAAVKDVLFAIKTSFSLPNVSYVLCYDTENMGMLNRTERDVDKVIEFFAKFVNVKISLYLDSVTLQKYTTEKLARTLSGNAEADPILVSRAISCLTNIFGSQDYHLYRPFLGDIRKIKRLINTLLLLEVEKVDFENSDFNNDDLINLVLVYVNYPHIFRKIYNTETDGKWGFFSAVGPYDSGYPKGELGNQNGSYKNSEQFTKYLTVLTEQQQFLLNKLFALPQRLGSAGRAAGISKEIASSYACFNGGGGSHRNLEAYLKLIVRQSKPIKSSQYRFYSKCKDEIASGTPFQAIFEKPQFAYSSGETAHAQLWRVIINSARDITPIVGANLSTYTVEHIPDYSLYEDGHIGIGFRDQLPAFLVRMLDLFGWSDKLGQHTHNEDEQVSEIAEWIFGEGAHVGTGLLDTLTSEDRGVLGLFDVLMFRLSCSADRGGADFNLQRALARHSGPAAPTTGLTTEIAKEQMREISQRVFSIFSAQYINQQVNVFDRVDALEFSSFGSKFSEYIEDKGDSVGRKGHVDQLKARVKAFAVFQLTNSLISMGVGCGYYDPLGTKDGHGIQEEMNEYLFSVCFDGTKKMRNYEHFLDYLLINFSNSFEGGSRSTYAPNIERLSTVLDRARLTDYWRRNAAEFKAQNFLARDKVVHTLNYSASYREDLKAVFRVLDAACDDKASLNRQVE